MIHVLMMRALKKLWRNITSREVVLDATLCLEPDAETKKLVDGLTKKLPQRTEEMVTLRENIAAAKAAEGQTKH